METRETDSKRSYHLSQLKSDIFLEEVIRQASVGGTKLDELDKALHDMGSSAGVIVEDLSSYFDDLIDADVLVPSIMPTLTCGTPLDELLRELADVPTASRVRSLLISVKQDLVALDNNSVGSASLSVEHIEDKLRILPARVESGRAVQVDLRKPVEVANVGKAVIAEVMSVVQTLLQALPPINNDDLEQFKLAFTGRYEQQWISLSRALSVESGLGYGGGSSSIKDLERQREGRLKDGHMSKLHSLLLDKLVESMRNGDTEIELLPSELKDSRESENTLPQSFSVLVTLLAKSAGALEQGEFKLLYKGGSGPSGGNLCGRFCAIDHDLESAVRAVLVQEEANDSAAIFAEVVHLPEERSGNVLSRPILRSYEIPYLGRSGAPAERQIAIQDLFVTVRNRKIVVASRSLGRRIIPRLSTAHNYNRASLLPVYRFLCDLQNEDGSFVPSFSWGPLERREYLPRVRLGRTILRPAQWRLSAQELKKISRSDRFESFAELRRLKLGRRLPRWVLLVEGDSTLPVDLDNPLSVDSFIHVSKRSSEIHLAELSVPESAAVSGPEGTFQHELVIPLRRDRTPEEEVSNSLITSMIKKELENKVDTVTEEERLHPPGSDWHYLKVYAGLATLDELITDSLGPLLLNLEREGIVNRWFFIRYADPEAHLRLRFTANSIVVYQKVTASLQNMLHKNIVWSIEVHTYRREIERYGGIHAMKIAEEIFSADSKAIVKILSNEKSLDTRPERWKIALLGIHRLLDDFKIPLTERIKLLDGLRKSFSAKQQSSPKNIGGIGEDYRLHRREILSILWPDQQTAGLSHDVGDTEFRERSIAITQAVAHLRALHEGGNVSRSLVDLIGDYIHLHANRVVGLKSWHLEAAIYDFLYRTYDGEVSRRDGGYAHPGT